MRKALPFVIGPLMFVVGAVWTLQGLGYLKGSVMTGQTVWATIGPIVAGLGIALVVVGAQARRR
jgi:hypothetical protein